MPRTSDARLGQDAQQERAPQEGGTDVGEDLLSEREGPRARSAAAQPASELPTSARGGKKQQVKKHKKNKDPPQTKKRM